MVRPSTTMPSQALFLIFTQPTWQSFIEVFPHILRNFFCQKVWLGSFSSNVLSDLQRSTRPLANAGNSIYLNCSLETTLWANSTIPIQHLKKLFTKLEQASSVPDSQHCNHEANFISTSDSSTFGILRHYTRWHHRSSASEPAILRVSLCFGKVWSRLHGQSWNRSP